MHDMYTLKNEDNACLWFCDFGRAGKVESVRRMEKRLVLGEAVVSHRLEGAAFDTDDNDICGPYLSSVCRQYDPLGKSSIFEASYGHCVQKMLCEMYTICLVAAVLELAVGNVSLLLTITSTLAGFLGSLNLAEFRLS